MRLLAIPLLTALLTAPVAAQDPNLPTRLPSDLDALAQRVEAAHHPKGKAEKVTGFQASLELHVLDAKAAQAGPVDVQVKYLEWQRPGSTKQRHLIRTEIREAGKPIESGRDRNGFWHLFQGQARDLTEADPQDLAACERNTNLARQLVRLTEPGAVLRGLTSPTPVRDEPLQLGREVAVPCEVVEGNLPAFPLLQQGGEDAPVRVKVFVNKSTSQVVAIEVSPLLNGAADPLRTELVRLVDLHEQDGFVVPRHLLHLQRGEEGRMRLMSKAVLTSLSLRSELKAEDFDRPGK